MKVENTLGSPAIGPACRRFVEALGNRELGRATSCFVHDGCLITADQTAIYGRERIRPLLVLRRVGTEWKLEIAALWGWV